MPITFGQVPTISAGDTELLAADFTDLLDSGETLTGTPTIVEVTTSDLTLSSKTINDTALSILGRTVAISHAAQCMVADGEVNSDGTPKLYRIRVTVQTTESRELTRDATFVCQ